MIRNVPAVLPSAMWVVHIVTTEGAQVRESFPDELSAAQAAERLRRLPFVRSVELVPPDRPRT
jgi:hypothetical protein